jgi:phenylacetate-CoA ligase
MGHLTPKSSVEGINWPAPVAGKGASLLALQFQLAQSQWWSPEELRRHQTRELHALVRHAYATVPYYRRVLSEAGFDPGAEITEASWSRVPLLARKAIQEEGTNLHSRRIPRGHGKVHELSTSGSTGMPITVRATQVTRFFWLAFTLRDQLWHGFDVTKKIAAIRDHPHGAGAYPDGLSTSNWGRAVEPAYATGPAVMLNIATPVAQQIEWLQRQDPDYVITFPSNLMALSAYCREQGITFPRLRMVETLAEILHAEVRAACREVWGVKVVDMYSAQEVGYIALQCPDHEHYHVQSENALVEVLDEKGRPCGPGETGRMVLTPLHNFAMPLIRYDVGDYGVVGEPCPCGRGLPVLTRG